MITTELAVIEPFPWAPLLGYLGTWLIPRVERIDNKGYERCHNGAIVRVTYRAGHGHLRVTAEGEITEDEIAARVARLFDVDQDTRAADRCLRDCPVLGPRVGCVPGLRPLGCWCSFELCVRTVVGSAGERGRGGDLDASAHRALWQARCQAGSISAPVAIRQPGAWRGRVRISPDFDALPKELEAVFRGEAE